MLGVRRGLRRRLVASVALAAAVGVVVAEPAVGQEPSTTTSTAPPADGTPVDVDEVAAAVAAEGWFADPGSSPDRDELARLATRLSARADPVGFVLLAQEPEGSSTAFAEDVLDALPASGEREIETVAVLSPEDVGVVSDTWDDEAIDAALDDALDDLRSEPVEGFESLADALAGQPTIAERDDEAGGSDGGSNTGWLVLLGLGAVALVAIRRFVPGLGGHGDDWDSDDYRRRSRWRRSRWRSSRRSGRSRSRRSSSRRSRRGRGGRRL